MMSLRNAAMEETPLLAHSRPGPSLARIATIWAMVVAACYAAAPDLFSDPFIRHDDYAALLGRAQVYYGSTLAEGRWLNYWWALRPALFDHHVIFALFHLFWALTATLTAGAMFPDERVPWRMALASMAFAFSPPMINTSLWPGTLLPGVTLLAGYAAVVAFGSMRARVWALPLFAVPALMSHGSFPLMMLVVALLAPGWTGWRPILGVTAVFASSVAAGMALSFSLNWAVHGVFGVRIDDWRGATPAHDVASALAMLSRYASLLAEHLEGMLHVPLSLGGPALLAAMLLLVAVDRAAAGRALFALAVIMGVQSTQGVATGLLTPFRGQFPLWAVVAAIPALGLGGVDRPGRRAFLAVGATLVLSVGVWHLKLMEAFFPPFQAATRAIAEEAAALDPAGGAALYVVGDSRELPGGEHTQSSLALRYRLEMLTGREVVMCVRHPEVCASLAQFSGPPFYPEKGYVRVLPGDALLLRLPDTPPGKIEDPTKWLG